MRACRGPSLEGAKEKEKMVSFCLRQVTPAKTAGKTAANAWLGLYARKTLDVLATSKKRARSRFERSETATYELSNTLSQTMQQNEPPAQAAVESNSPQS